MIPTIRTIALLMLLAGVSLGIFAGSLLADREEPAPVTLDKRIDERLRLLDELHDLTPEQRSRIRQVYQWHSRKRHDKFRELYEQHQIEFTELNDEAARRIDDIIEGP